MRGEGLDGVIGILHLPCRRQIGRRGWAGGVGDGVVIVVFGVKVR